MFFYSENLESIINLDPYLSNISLLLKGDTSGISLMDSSNNNLSITSFGNTSTSSFSPFNKEDKKWSVYFPPQTITNPTYGDVAKNSLMVNGTTSTGNITTNWTFEVWFKGGSISSRNYIAAKSDLNSDNQNSWTAAVNSDGTFSFRGYYGSGYPVSSKSFFSTSRVDDNQWHHIAFVKEATTYKIFIDGIKETEEVFSTSFNAGTAENITIGGSTINVGTGGDYGRTDCYLTNLRINTDALYTSNFTPSISPLTAISGTVLLTCQDKYFIDNSPNNWNITIQKGTPIVEDESSFANEIGVSGKSVYFDGSGDYLLANNTSLKLSGSYTVETWVYPKSYGDVTNGSGIFFNGTTSSNINRVQLELNSNGSITANGFSISATPIWVITSATNLIKLNTWNHLALSSDGTTIRLFINGNLVGSSSATLISTLPDTFYIGFHRSSSALRYLNGFIDDFRLTQGVARYTGSFTPPSEF